MSEKQYFMFPPGRIVSGDVYKANTKDNQGNPLVDKTGQPKVNFYIGVAIPKSNLPWESELWGQHIMNVARAGVPNVFDPQTGQLFAGRSFAFKVTDGDSAIPNQNNKKPCDQEGYPGHWVLNFSNGFAPKPVDRDGKLIIEPDAIKRGYWAEVYSSIVPNTDARNPGIFLNHETVSLAGYGLEIHGGIDTTTLGFGQAALPAGASLTPVAQAQAPSQVMQQQAIQQPVQQAVVQQPVQQQAIQQPVQQQAIQQPVQQQVIQQPVQQAIQQPVQQAIQQPVQQAVVQPANDLIQNPVVQPPPMQQAVVQPPPMQVDPGEELFNVNGTVYKRSQLLAMQGWTEEMVAQQPKG